MPDFMRAHGYEPGPTQRPVLAGAIAGAVGTVPATAILLLFDSLAAEAVILGLSEFATETLGVLVMSIAGSLYGRIFQRAANDRYGGWLFGAAFGFVLWTGGAVMILPLFGSGQAPAGPAAIGVFLALVLWGAAAGGLFPIVHRPLYRKADLTIKSHTTAIGPSAATSEGHVKDMTWHVKKQ